MTLRVAVFIILFLFSFKGFSINQPKLTIDDFEVIIEFQNDSSNSYSESKVTKVKFKRGKAILFTVFTGFLGGHRIYFGTHHRTPIIYSITLGGLGILPLVDLINIIFTKDLSKFDNKTQIIMWGD